MFEFKMIDSTGYVIPKKALNKLYLSSLPAFAVGLIIGPLLGITTFANIFNTTILLTAIVTGVYFYTKQYKWVYLTSKGIEGLSPSGDKIVIEWADPITVKTIRAFAGIPGLGVQSAKNRGALFIPTSIATATEFQANLNRVAPQNHQLVLASKNIL